MLAQFNCASLGKHFSSDIRYSLRKKINFARSFVVPHMILTAFLYGFEKIFFFHNEIQKKVCYIKISQRHLEIMRVDAN